jgi:hypothetical protein
MRKASVRFTPEPFAEQEFAPATDAEAAYLDTFKSGYIQRGGTSDL